MAETPLARRILAFAAAALLSGIAAPVVEAQSLYLEVDSNSVTIAPGQSSSYRIRMKDPTAVSLEDRPADKRVVVPDDWQGWWIRIRVSSNVENSGYVGHEYDADGDGDADISWVPSVGWEFDHTDIPAGENVSPWREITIYASDDLARPVTLTFSHEVWEDDTYCPEHEIGRVAVSISDDGGGNPDPEVDPSVTVSPTTLSFRRGAATATRSCWTARRTEPWGSAFRDSRGMSRSIGAV